MASVTSLDQDVRKLRLDRYTPSAAREAQRWIEGVLQEDLPVGDLMDSLRDGVILCKLVNLVAQPGIRYKTSTMPFVQMENISNFLRACEMPPLSLPSHDRFLTVDLYDQKDPAQVLQCLAAFSRRVNAIDPAAFPTTIGAKGSKVAMSPSTTGPRSPSPTKPSAYTVNISSKPTSSFGSPVGANTLNRGGLASSGPVSSWSRKLDEDRTVPAWNIHQYGYMGGANQGNQGVAFGGRRQIVSPQPDVPSLAEKEKRLREKIEQEQRSLAQAEQTQRMQVVEEQLETKEQAHPKHDDRTRERTTSNPSLNGQFLSQYQANQPAQIRPTPQIQPQHSAEQQKIAELERQLAEAKAQIAQQGRPQISTAASAATIKSPQRLENPSTPSATSLPPRPSAPTPNTAAEHEIKRTLPLLPATQQQHADKAPSPPTDADASPPDPRPTFAKPAPAPAPNPPRTAHKSLLEREMERDRDRQREWAENQRLQNDLRAAATSAGNGGSRGTESESEPGDGDGRNWNGYARGGDRGRGGRRQIIGPRPPPL